MQLYLTFFIFLFISINCIENEFKIDFTFLLPDYNTTNLIGFSSNDDTQPDFVNNKLVLQNQEYYRNIKPMTNLCIGNPFQCFQIPISFNMSETIINLNLVNFNYQKSSSFSLLSDIDTIFYASDTIKLSKRAKNVISEFNFILTNESNTFLSNLSVIGLGKNRLP